MGYVYLQEVTGTHDIHRLTLNTYINTSYSLFPAVTLFDLSLTTSFPLSTSVSASYSSSIESVINIYIYIQGEGDSN